MRKHTPGRWYAAEVCVSSDHPDCFTVRFHCESREPAGLLEARENARVAAAAPELLEVAHGVMAWWEEHQYDADGEYIIYRDEPKFVEQARAAIAKARGEQA